MKQKLTKEERAAKAAKTYTVLKGRGRDIPEKTEDEYVALVAAHMPEDCPGTFAAAAPCDGCPARHDCDEAGDPPKAKVEVIPGWKLP